MKCILCGSTYEKGLMKLKIKDHYPDGDKRYTFYDEELEDIPDGIHVFCSKRKNCRLRILNNATGYPNGSWREKSAKAKI